MSSIKFDIVENKGGFSASCPRGFMGFYGGDRYNGGKQGCHLGKEKAAVFVTPALAQMAADGFEQDSRLPWDNPYNTPVAS